MRSSFCTNVFRPEEMQPALRHLAGCGIQAVEFWQQYLDKADLDWLQDQLKNTGLAVSQLCPYFDLTAGEPAWGESLRLAQRYVDLARRFDARLIRVFTGKLGSEEAGAARWKDAIRGLQECCDYGLASGRRVGFAAETHPGSLMDTIDSARRLVEDVARPNFGLNLQVPVGDESIDRAAEILGSFTIHLHAHNWVRHDDRWDLTFLDEGDRYSFESFLQTLVAKGFNGDISIEHGSHHPPFEVAKREAAYLNPLIARLQPNVVKSGKNSCRRE